jgi:hypothetical protein
LRWKLELIAHFETEKAMPKELIDELPERLEHTLAQVLTPGETVHVKLKGAYKQALVCTDKKVIILKAGFMAGHFFGDNTFQMPYGRISGAEVKFHLLTGYFELSSGGMENTQKSYWSTSGEKSNPWKAPNCVCIEDRTKVDRFRAACDFILTFQPNQHPLPDAPSSSGEDDVISMLERLATLKERGLLTDQEFQEKKAELLRTPIVRPREPKVEQDRTSSPNIEPNSDGISAANADAMIARYLASNSSLDNRKGSALPATPVFGKRR